MTVSKEQETHFCDKDINFLDTKALQDLINKLKVNRELFDYHTADAKNYSNDAFKACVKIIWDIETIWQLWSIIH